MSDSMIYNGACLLRRYARRLHLIHVTGSVGLFSCSIENKTASDQVLQAVGEALQKFPFSYQGARILSGQEEGAFGWVTVNYLDDRLTQVSRCCSRRTGSTGFVLFLHSGGLRFTVLRFCTATGVVTIKKKLQQKKRFDAFENIHIIRQRHNCIKSIL